VTMYTPVYMEMEWLTCLSRPNFGEAQCLNGSAAPPLISATSKLNP